MMRPSPEPRVSGFLDSIAGEGLGLSCVTVWEVLNGIAPRSIPDLLDDFFEDRVLDWTASDAQECPRIMTNAVAGECLSTSCFPDDGSDGAKHVSATVGRATADSQETCPSTWRC